MLNKTIRPARAKGTKYLRSTSSFTIKQKDKTTGSSTLAAFRIAAANFELLCYQYPLSERTCLLSLIGEEKTRMSIRERSYGETEIRLEGLAFFYLICRSFWLILGNQQTQDILQPGFLQEISWVRQTNLRRFQTCVFILLGKSTVSMCGALLPSPCLRFCERQRNEGQEPRARVGRNKKVGGLCMANLSIYTAIFYMGS